MVPLPHPSDFCKAPKQSLWAFLAKIWVEHDWKLVPGRRILKNMWNLKDLGNICEN